MFSDWPKICGNLSTSSDTPSGLLLLPVDTGGGHLGSGESGAECFPGKEAAGHWERQRRSRTSQGSYGVRTGGSCGKEVPRKVLIFQTVCKRPAWAASDAKKLEGSAAGSESGIYLLARGSVGAGVPATTSSFQVAGRKMGKDRSTSGSLSNNFCFYISLAKLSPMAKPNCRLGEKWNP